MAKLKSDAVKTYVVEKVVNDYLACIEEVINIPKLKACLEKLEGEGKVSDVLKEIICRVRWNSTTTKTKTDNDASIFPNN